MIPAALFSTTSSLLQPKAELQRSGTPAAADTLPLFFCTAPGHDHQVLQALPLATQLRLLGQVPGARLKVIEQNGTAHNILHPSQLWVTEAEWELQADPKEGTYSYVLVGESKRLNCRIPLQRLGYFDLSPTERRKWMDNTLSATLALLNSQRP